MAFDIDVRDVVPSIHVPALIIHTTGDRVCHVENARWLAAHLAGARYVEFPGGDHLPWFDPDRTVAEIREFITGSREPEEPDRVLATVLFTDVVGSTELATRLGDRRWRDLLETPSRRGPGGARPLPRPRGRHGGRRVPRGVRRARPARSGPRRRSWTPCAATGLEIRAGIHTGEIEQLPIGDIRGIAVHIGARVAAAAGRRRGARLVVGPRPRRRLRVHVRRPRRAIS